MRIHGLEPRQGETAFAFLVLRFAQPADHAALVTVVRQFAPIMPDVDAFLDELSSRDDEQPFHLLGMPWVPPEAGSDVELQRRLVEASATNGVEEAWFFQTGTSLPIIGADDGNPFDEDDAGTGIDGEAFIVEQTVDADAYTDDGSEGTQPVQIFPAPSDDDDDDDDEDDEDDDDDDDEDDDYGDDEDDDDATWSHGPPPMVAKVRFPVDGYPQILEELDWEDVGIAFKLAGPALGGESTVLACFHTLWLTPYGGRHRNAAVTIDRVRHAAHLWVDRFAVPSSPEEQVGHLLWILSKLDEIVPVIHARFGGATMQQKYGGLMGDTSEPFVLGGNPLLAVHAQGGDDAIDAWIAAQSDWSPEEVAQMLRELAIDIVTSGADEDDDDDDDDDDDADEEIGVEDIEEAVDALFDDADDGDDDDDDDRDEDDARRTTRMPALRATDDEPADAAQDHDAADDDEEEDEDVAADDDGADDDGDDVDVDGDVDDGDVDDGDVDDRDVDDVDDGDVDDGDDDDGADGDVDDGDVDDVDDGDVDDVDVDDDGDEDRSRYVARHATDVLVARAHAGLLDARVADTLRPILATSERYEHRRTRVILILGALRDRASVPALIRVLETSPIKSMSDSITKEDLLAETSNALAAIGDPSAVPALARVIAQPTSHADDPRAPAAHALAACLAAAPEPRDVPDAVIDAMLKTIALRNDGELNAELHFAYGKLARTVTPARREHMRTCLAEGITSRSDSTPTFARAVALTMAGDAKHDELRAGLHRALSEVDYNHEYTVRNIRFALRIADHFPELVDAADLAWLVRFEEPDIRAGAHALLDKLGAPIAAAPVFDPTIVGGLSDDALVALLSEPHLVGRASLVAEAGRRDLASARAAIVKAAHGAIDRARPHGELLDPDGKLLEAAVHALRTGPLDADVIALFDRMLRHSNHHVKWELLQEPPDDDRLIGGMFVVLAAKWGWQHSTAKEWLSARQGTEAFEEERKRAGVATIAEDDEYDEDDEDDDDDDKDDEDDDELLDDEDDDELLDDEDETN